LFTPLVVALVHDTIDANTDTSLHLLFKGLFIALMLQQLIIGDLR